MNIKIGIPMIFIGIAVMLYGYGSTNGHYTFMLLGGCIMLLGAMVTVNKTGW